MLTQHIALVPEANGVSAADLARVSAALQKQVLRDVGPFWNVSASVDAFPSLEDVPVGYWPIIVTFRALGRQAGVQLDRNGQPFAQVELSPSWSLFASRACLEMLVNPYGNRTVTTTSPRADQGPVEVLVEVCGPCADARYAYTVNDLLVSDFCTPAYFGAASLSTSPRYTFSGAVTAAFQVAPGGHLAWYDAVSDSWWLRNHWDATPAELKLGSIERQVVSARELAFERMPARLTSGASVEALETLVGVSRQHALQASQFRAHRMRALLPSSSSMPPQQPQWHATFAAAQVLSRETQRKRADRHFDLLVEMLHEDPEQLEMDADAEPELEEDAGSSMQLEAALEQEHTQLDTGSPTVPPPLPAAATSIAPVAHAASPRRSSAPPATPTAAHNASRTSERRSVAPAASAPGVPEAQPAPRNAPSTAPVAPADTTHAAHTSHATELRAQPLAAPRIEPLPRMRTTSTRASESSTPWLLGAVAAVVLLGLGWASRGLLAPSSATTSAPSAPSAALTTTVSAATEAARQPSVAASAPAEAAPAAQPAVQPPVVAATAAPTAAVHAATASAQPVPPALPAPPSAAAGTATASTAAAASPATPADLVASRSRHPRRHSDLPETEAPAATPNTAPVQAPSIDDLLNSRR